MSLIIHPNAGPFFTWSNRRLEDYQCRKLDRIFINPSWIGLPPFSAAEFLEPGISDHSSALLLLRTPLSSGPKPFKFFNHWCDSPDFMPLLREVRSRSTSGNPLISVYGNIRDLKCHLKQINAKDKRDS